MVNCDSMVFWFMRSRVLRAMIQGDEAAAGAWANILGHHARRLEHRAEVLAYAAAALKASEAVERAGLSWLN